MKDKYVFVIISFLFLFKEMDSQDTLKIKMRHIVGFGLQQTPNTAKTEDHFKSTVNYRAPGSDLFYRLILPNRRNSITAVTGDFFYRSGQGYQGDGGLGGYYDYAGNFEFVKFNIGASQYGRTYLNKKNFVDIGIGTNIGGLIYSNGTITESGYANTGGPSYSKVGINTVLNKLYLAINAEININFKLSPKHYLIMGVKQFLETSDGFSGRVNLTMNGFIAYSIR